MGLYSKYFAEFIGTFALTFFGASAIVANSFSGGALGVTGIALAHGLTLMALVFALGGISGAHVNPAVTLGVLLAKAIDIKTASLYWVSQFAGAIVAGFAVLKLMPTVAVLATSAGSTLLAPGISPIRGTAIEAILTFFLVSAVLLTAVKKAVNPVFSGLTIGMTLTIAILAAGPVTGASLNPARTLGPAIASGALQNLWVFFLGPAIGAVLAFLVYKYIYDEK